jgi:TPR repeat protein
MLGLRAFHFTQTCAQAAAWARFISNVKHQVPTAEDIYYDSTPIEAWELLSVLAAEGDHEAEFYLGHLSEEKSPANSVEALVWYKKAAASGLLEAKHWVASFTYHGCGTPQNIQDAVLHFRECAHAGLSSSQWKLGQHLLQFPESRTEAIHWLRLAAKQNHTGAIELLAEVESSNV